MSVEAKAGAYNTDPEAIPPGATCTTGSLVRLVYGTAPDAHRSLQTLAKVVGNVAKKPGELKFRELKKANASVRGALLDVRPCLQLLRRCGFVDRGEVVRLQPSGLRPGEVARLASALRSFPELAELAEGLASAAAGLGVVAAAPSGAGPSGAPARMPTLFYGTAWKETWTRELVVQAVLMGFRGIDTAGQPQHYREDLVGEALQQLKAEHGIGRESLYLQTKFTSLASQEPESAPYDRRAPLAQQVEQSFQRSLQNLGVERVDCLLMHGLESTWEATLEVWRALERIQRRGGAASIGVSNCYDLAWLQEICYHAEVQPAVVQNRFTWESGYDQELRRFCKLKGIAYQPFAVLTGNQHLLTGSAVTSTARRLGITPQQALFLFLARSEGTHPLTGTCSQEHMRHDLYAVGGSLALTSGEEIFIRSMLQ